MSGESQVSAIDEYWMGYAAELARHGWYSSPPNPRVGCVIVSRDRLLGYGWHTVSGGAHAERAALDDAGARGSRMAGATVYVTLEPCCVHGRTPPCSDALIEAGVARVVIGCEDPNPAVTGGAAALREAGVDVTIGVNTQACAALNPGFDQRMRMGRPRVRAKLAMTLDGRIAAANGESQWITEEGSRRDVHRLRAESSAVLVGRGTQMADDPALSVRLPGEWRQPYPVVMDRELAMRTDARLLDPARKPLIFTATDDAERIEQYRAAGACVHCVAQSETGVDASAVLHTLAVEYEVNDVLVEAGPTLVGSLATYGLVDEFIFYLAPKLLGSAGRGALDLPGIDCLAAAHDLVVDRVDPVGPDWRFIARPR